MVEHLISSSHELGCIFKVPNQSSTLMTSYHPLPECSRVVYKTYRESSVRASRYMLKEDCRWDRTNISKHNSNEMTVAQYWNSGQFSSLFEHHSSNPKDSSSVSVSQLLEDLYCSMDHVAAVIWWVRLVRARCAAS